MKIAHVAVATPGRSGLYETTRDLAAAEIALGADARIVDPTPTSLHPGVEDRGVPMADAGWARAANVVADHSGIETEELEHIQKPIIHVTHGRPQYSFNGERGGRGSVHSYWDKYSRDERFKAVVTFWPKHAPYLSVVWGDVPVHVLPAPVDIEYWCPAPAKYTFNGRGGEPNVVISDSWSDDIDPYPCIAAFLWFAKTNPKAKLHFFGLPEERRGLDVYFNKLASTDNLGEIHGRVKGLKHVYRAADLVISPHSIATRTIRESMACGTQILSGRSLDPTLTVPFAREMEKRLGHPHDTRQTAEKLFNSVDTAKKFLEIVNSIED